MIACKVGPNSSVTMASSVTIPAVDESAVTDIADDSIVLSGI
jgi:hypothetical protein